MCGIIGYTGAQQATAILLDGLRRLEYRGYDSAGIAVQAPDAAVTRVARAQGKLAALRRQVAAEPLPGTCGIGHTRWATHGPPTQANAHPHRTGKVSVVHNGIIENHLELRDELARAGCEFRSDTDTEIFAHLIDRALGGRDPDLVAAVRAALQRVRGTWALCVVHDDLPGRIVAARQGSPLMVGLGGPTHGEGAGPENFVASDVAAMLDHTRTVIDLEDGDVTAGAVRIQDATGAAVERPVRRVTWSPLAAEKQGFKHFMLKEIHDQPQAIADTLLGRLSVDAGDVDFGDVDLDPAQVRRVVLLGCGTSHHAALAGRYMIEQVARVPVQVELASEFRYREPLVGAGDLVIAVSQSGETADTLAAMGEAARLGARTLTICNVVGSSMARAADQVIYTHAGPEISVASTKAFTTQLAALAMLAIHLGRRSGALDRAGGQRLAEALRRVPQAVAHLVQQGPAIRAIARRYLGARGLLYLGRGLGFPVALEGALKLKEISYMHAEGYASGEMKHGPIALVDEDLPVVVIALRGPGYDKVVANLEEVRARGGRIIALSSAGDAAIADLSHDVVVVPDLDPIAQPMVATVPLQLFAYHMADLKGTDVDQPRNLAKSVTVE